MLPTLNILSASQISSLTQSLLLTMFAVQTKAQVYQNTGNLQLALGCNVNV